MTQLNPLPTEEKVPAENTTQVKNSAFWVTAIIFGAALVVVESATALSRSVVATAPAAMNANRPKFD